VAGTVLAGLIALAVWVWFCNKSSSAEVPPPVVVEDAEELLFQENLGRLWGNCEKDGVLKGHLYEIKDFSKYLSDINVDFKKISSDEIDEHFVKFLKEIKKKK